MGLHQGAAHAPDYCDASQTPVPGLQTQKQTLSFGSQPAVSKLPAPQMS
jgi:hypothetical protein